MGRVRIEPWTYTSYKGKSTRLFYWREHTAHIFMNIRVCKVMYICSCECVWLPRKVCNLSVQWLAIERMSWLQIPKHIHTPVSCLPGIMLVLTRAPRSISHGCFVWHFVCLVFLLCFLPCLGWLRLKYYTISWFDFLAKNISPTIFAFCLFCSINMLFAFFMFCYVKCCKFILVLQSGSPTLCWDMLQVLVATNYIPSVVLALFLLSRRSILWNINGMVSSIFLTQPFLVRRLWWI